MSLRVEPLTGVELPRGLPALARLRIAVFREWPYLYDGSMAHEAAYLARLSAAGRAVIVAAFDGSEIVGCATAAPMAEVEGEFSAPFSARGDDIARIFYYGESVLLPAYRGKGVGRAFFDRREERVRALGGFERATFCAVVRPPDHPLRPADYVPLDGFWRRRGFHKVEGLVGAFSWKDIDQPAQTSKPMQYWMGELA